MKVNIYSHNNGLGLQHDAELLLSILTSAGINAVYIDWNKRTGIRSANIGIHLELIKQNLIGLAPTNLYIPNPEWCDPDQRRFIPRMTAILCKTHETENIFKRFGRPLIYTSFTSKDMYVANVERRRAYLHLSGGSSHKGSEFVLQAWKGNPVMPLLTMQRIKPTSDYNIHQGNYFGLFTRVPDIRHITNTCQFHLCPSKTEGFGHYINEALSVGAIVITTDAPPMNELVSNLHGLLIQATAGAKHHLGTEYNTTPKAIIEAVQYCESLTDAEIIQRSQLARQAYLDRDAYFKKRIIEILKGI